MRPSLDWLLVFLPVTVALAYGWPGHHTAIFVCACLAILPLAGWLGRATEHLAAHVGEGAGGLLNATFGNAAELIIALAAMRKGLHDVVKASLTGSIIGNILLVAGLSIFCGGLRFRVQRFGALGARAQSTMLTLAAVSLVVPAGFHYLSGPSGWQQDDDLSAEIAVVLLLLYFASLWFSLRTHKEFFAGEEGGTEAECTHGPGWSRGRSLAVMAGVTALIAWMSEILVGSVEAAAHTIGMTSLFVGVVVVAIVGNAAEHSTAVLAAMKNRMDLSLGIAIGSSVQVALFVAPLLVLASHVIGPRPMDLVFTPAEVLAVVMSVWIMGQVADDGHSNWLEGALLLGVYLILSFAFYFLPEGGAHAGVAPAPQPGAPH